MKNSIFIKLILVFNFQLITIVSIAQFNDWNVALGGNTARNGLSQHLGPLVELGENPELLWSGGEYSIAAGLPVIEGGKLVVHRRWSSSEDESWIVCYNVYDGTELWKITLPVDPQSDNYGKVTGVNDGQVYATRNGGFYEPSWLYALDIETGTLLWQSEDKITEYFTETVTFRENGDIIAGNENEIRCISKNDGTTLWELNRFTWSADGSSVSTYGNKGYYWDKAPGTIDMVVSVCDLETGTLLYQSDAITSASMQAQQSNLFVGLDGTVYAPRSNGQTFDAIVSLTDLGNSFQENWRYPIGFVNFCSHGVGPDNTVYTYSLDREVIRLDPTTGDVLNTSIEICNENQFFSPWMAIGEDGMVYLAVEQYPFNKLYIFTPELELLWSEEIYGLRGVALGDEVMVVNGKNDIIRAYQGRPSVSVTEYNIGENISIYPNPTSDIISISGDFDQNQSEITINIFDVTGKIVYSSTTKSIIDNTLKLDISSFENGIYNLKVISDSNSYLQKFIKQ